MARGLDTRQFLEVIRTSSLFMSNLIDDLLDVAKIESGELSLDLAPVDLEDVVRRNVALNQTLAVGKQTEILLRCAPYLPSSLMQGKMDQVLNNLISNAVKFSPPGSRVEVDLRSEGDRFTISVRDQGPGISEEGPGQTVSPLSADPCAGDGWGEEYGSGACDREAHRRGSRWLDMVGKLSGRGDHVLCVGSLYAIAISWGDVGDGGQVVRLGPSSRGGTMPKAHPGRG